MSSRSNPTPQKSIAAEAERKCWSVNFRPRLMLLADACLPDPSAPRRLALASTLPKPGAKIFVIGTPLGFLQQAISEGIVSGIRKTDTGTLLQITVSVSPGSSGGPVLNSAGQVVGMVVGVIEEGQLLNFAVASSEIQRVIASARKPYNAPTPEVLRKEKFADLVSKLSAQRGQRGHPEN